MFLQSKNLYEKSFIFFITENTTPDPSSNANPDNNSASSSSSCELFIPDILFVNDFLLSLILSFIPILCH